MSYHNYSEVKGTFMTSVFAIIGEVGWQLFGNEYFILSFLTLSIIPAIVYAAITSVRFKGWLEY